MSCLEVLSNIANIITPLVLGGYFIYRQYIIKRRKWWKKYIGSWGNEGVLDESIPVAFIELDLEVDLNDGEISGVLNIRRSNGEYEEYNISITGYIKFQYAKVSMSNIKGGMPIDYGTIKLKVDGKNLKWELIEGDSTLFPKYVTLYKTTPIKVY
jgi:hypothetical protein